jgi:hypothetical protein
MTEQEARDALGEAIRATGDRPLTDADIDAAMRSIIASVRAETLRELRGVVARVECVRCETDNPRVPCDCPEVLSRDALLAAIDALAHPEGTA